MGEPGGTGFLPKRQQNTFRYHPMEMMSPALSPLTRLDAKALMLKTIANADSNPQPARRYRKVGVPTLSSQLKHTANKAVSIINRSLLFESKSESHPPYSLICSSSKFDKWLLVPQ